jgi:hypothetical protein
LGLAGEIVNDAPAGGPNPSNMRRNPPLAISPYVLGGLSVTVQNSTIALVHYLFYCGAENGAAMMKTEKFFEERSDQSEVKARIVQRCYYADRAEEWWPDCVH